MSKATVIRKISDDLYRSDCGHVMQREYGETPGGNPLNGRWVLRAPDGAWIDFNESRFDLAEHHGFSIQNKESENAASNRPS